MLEPAFIELLACPNCKGELRYEADPRYERRGRLICPACRLLYRVDEDIPNISPEAAEPLQEDE